MRDRGLHERILGLPAPWHVEDVELREDAREVIVKVGLRRPVELACPKCGEAMDGYDHRRRSWRHLDTCQYKTIIKADVPHGQCRTHGVRQIEVPWAEERSRFTALFEALAIDWLRETSQLAVARRLKLTWAEVHGIMDRAVARGLARREQEVIPFLGIDETSFQKRQESSRPCRGDCRSRSPRPSSPGICPRSHRRATRPPPRATTTRRASSRRRSMRTSASSRSPRRRPSC